MQQPAHQAESETGVGGTAFMSSISARSAYCPEHRTLGESACTWLAAIDCPTHFPAMQTQLEAAFASNVRSVRGPLSFAAWPQAGAYADGVVTKLAASGTVVLATELLASVTQLLVEATALGVPKLVATSADVEGRGCELWEAVEQYPLARQGKACVSAVGCLSPDCFVGGALIIASCIHVHKALHNSLDSGTFALQARFGMGC